VQALQPTPTRRSENEQIPRSAWTLQSRFSFSTPSPPSAHSLHFPRSPLPFSLASHSSVSHTSCSLSLVRRSHARMETKAARSFVLRHSGFSVLQLLAIACLSPTLTPQSA
jgi:hypothetical protein